MKAYKGFDSDMKCRGFQYKEGGKYETSRVQVCKAGFHACRNPVDCLAYYTPGEGSIYREVVLSGNVEEQEEADDTKVAASRIRIGKRLSVADMVEAVYAYVRAKCKRGLVVRRKHIAAAGENGCASVRNCGVAFAGINGVANAGLGGTAFAAQCGVARVGDFGMAIVRKYGAASAGNFSLVAVGQGSVVSAGYYGVIAAGMHSRIAAGSNAIACVGSCGAASVGVHGVAVAFDFGMASAGDFGLAVAGSIASCGDCGIAVAYGPNARVMGGARAVLIIVQKLNGYNSVSSGSWTIHIDNINYKPDTWYTVRGGAVVEALEAARDLLLPQCNGGTAFAKACGETVNKIMDAMKEKRASDGNAAAMREAVEKCRHVIHCAIVSDILRGDDAYDAMNIASSALAAPPRNCDVGTAFEQENRFIKFCGRYPNCKRCPLGNDNSRCAFVWMQMPYEEGGEAQ